MGIRTLENRQNVVKCIQAAGKEIADRADEITPEQIEKVRSITIKIEILPHQAPTLSWKVEGSVLCL